MPIGKLEYKRKRISDYVRILDTFAKDSNYNRFNMNLYHWSLKNKRNPKNIYQYQLKILKGK